MTLFDILFYLLIGGIVGYLGRENKHRKDDIRSLQHQIENMRIEIHNIHRHQESEHRFRGHFPS